MKKIVLIIACFVFFLPNIVLGGSLSFNGNGSVSLGDVLNPGTNNFSVSFRFKADSLHAGNIITKGEAIRVSLTPEGKIWVNLKGDNKMAHPTQSCADETFLYVVDDSLNKIFKYRLSNFGFITSTGTTGSGVGQFNTPKGCTVVNGFVYIVDYNNSRVVKLDTDLNWITSYGSLGAGDDNYTFPTDITNDGTYFYIADYLNYRIVKRLISDFSFVSAYGTQGSEIDQFNRPMGIAYADGFLYVTDLLNYRIVKLSTDFIWQTAIGSRGTGDDQFNGVFDIGTDGTYIYVVDKENRRIVKRNASDLSFVASAGSHSTNANASEQQYYYAEGVTVSGSYIYVSNSSNKSLEVWDKDLNLINRIKTYGDPPDYRWNRGLSIDGNYIYEDDHYNGRIIKARKEEFSLVASAGSWGTQDGQYNLNHDIWVDPSDDRAYVVDTYNNRVVAIRKSDLGFVTKFSGPFGGSNLSMPKGILGDSEHIYIADTHNHRILKINKADFSFIAAVGSQGTGTNQFNYPQGLSLDSGRGYLYVTDIYNNRVVVLKSSDLSWVTTFGSVGTGDGQIGYPQGVEYDSESDSIFVAEYSNNRVQRFSAAGYAYQSKIGGTAMGVGTSQFEVPHGIRVDDDYLYVQDIKNNRILKYDKTTLQYVDQYESLSSSAYSSTVIQPNQWYAVTVTVSNLNLLKLYINGSLEAETDISFKLNNYISSSQLLFGNGVNGLKGKMHGISWYNKVLSASEASYLNQQGEYIDGSNLISYWSFAETGGSTLVDTRGGNNGVVSNASFNSDLLVFAPGAPSVATSSVTASSLKLNLNKGANSNDVNILYSICKTNDGLTCDLNGFLQSNGALSTSTVWLSYDSWGGSSGKDVAGLTPSTSYKFMSKTKNSANNETNFSAASASVMTAAAAALPISVGGSGGASATIISMATSSLSNIAATSTLLGFSVTGTLPIIAQTKILLTTSTANNLNSKSVLKMPENNQSKKTVWVFTKSLRYGSRGKEVKQLQTRLKQLGYFNFSSITGFFGSITRRAVIELQKDFGLAPVGFVGPQTRKVLNRN